jgi:hypothetical protein
MYTEPAKKQKIGGDREERTGPVGVNALKRKPAHSINL